jgi:hypothetical protein
VEFHQELIKLFFSKFFTQQTLKNILTLIRLILNYFPTANSELHAVHVLAVSLPTAFPLVSATVMADINIRVYAQFPLTPPPNGDEERWVWLDSANWKWTNCLTFPVERLNFTRSPYKWIRYGTGIVVGAHGDFFPHQDSVTPIAYDTPLPVASVDLYYRTTDDERLRMFPLDPMLTNSRIITSTGQSTRRANFRNDVKQRDGDRCVLTGVIGDYCDAAHLLHHSKGNLVRISSYDCPLKSHCRQYIAFTRGRCRDPNDVIVDIDNVRNGSFIHKTRHAGFGLDIAILVVRAVHLKFSQSSTMCMGRHQIRNGLR